MNEVCRIGWMDMVRLQQERQVKKDSLLIAQIQQTDSRGKEGDALPYLLSMDAPITVIMYCCFFLLAYVLGNGKRHLLQRFKNFFHTKERSSLFDDRSGSDMRYTAALLLVSCILSGFCVYDYYSDCSPQLFQTVPHSILLSVYILSVILFLMVKRLLYQFINWIFFYRQKSTLWLEAYSDVIIWTGLLLFPIVLLIVYFDLMPHWAIIFVGCVFLIMKSLLLYKCIKNFFSHLYGLLHLIVYFCALEIVPDLLVWKGLSYMNDVLILNF